MRRRKESKGNAESLRADPLSAVAELASFRVGLGRLRVLVWRSEATPLVKDKHTQLSQQVILGYIESRHSFNYLLLTKM